MTKALRQATLAIRRPAVIARFKESLVDEPGESPACQVCGWCAPPALYDGPFGPGVRTLVHGHHVIPIACGGRDIPENLVLLCPNHHALAHRMGRKRKPVHDHGDRLPRWEGPQSPLALIRQLTLLDEDPAQWLLDRWHQYRRAERADLKRRGLPVSPYDVNENPLPRALRTATV